MCDGGGESSRLDSLTGKWWANVREWILHSKRCVCSFQMHVMIGSSNCCVHKIDFNCLFLLAFYWHWAASLLVAWCTSLFAVIKHSHGLLCVSMLNKKRYFIVHLISIVCLVFFSLFPRYFYRMDWFFLASYCSEEQISLFETKRKW